MNPIDCGEVTGWLPDHPEVASSVSDHSNTNGFLRNIAVAGIATGWFAARLSRLCRLGGAGCDAVAVVRRDERNRLVRCGYAPLVSVWAVSVTPR